MKRAVGLICMAACVALLLTPLALWALRPAEGETYAASGRTVALTEIELPGGTISVNMADLYELTELPGIGETIGQRIIDAREFGGPFYYPEDLLAVRGIGGKTLEGLRELLDMTLPEDGK